MHGSINMYDINLVCTELEQGKNPYFHQVLYRTSVNRHLLYAYMHLLLTDTNLGNLC